MMLTAAGGGNLINPSFAGVAQLVEHHLAKVAVESSSLFARSISPDDPGAGAPGSSSIRLRQMNGDAADSRFRRLRPAAAD